LASGATMVASKDKDLRVLDKPCGSKCRRHANSWLG
jgi:hypothetical protein